MTDRNFESILAGQLRQYADQGVRPIDRYAIAETTIANGRRSARRRWSLGLHRDALVPILIGLLLLALVVGALVGGFRPFAEDLTGRLLAVSGNPVPVAPGEGPMIDVTCLSLDAYDVDRGAAHRLIDCADRLQVSPDGTRAADRGADGVTIIDLRAGNRRMIADTRGAFPSAWSPGGRWLQWVTCTSDAEPCDVVIGAPEGSDRNHLPYPVVGGYNGSFRWSPDDRRFFIREESGMFVGNGDGSQLERAGFDQEVWAWSPDGNQVAYGAGTNPFPGGGARALDLYIADADGTGARNLTAFDSESAYGAAWSPDGRTLAVVSSAPRLAGSSSLGPAQLWVVDLPGSRRRVDLRTDLVDAQGRDWATSIRWSPDGSRFAFESASSASTAPSNVFLVPVNGSGVIVLHDATLPAWSSDGRSIAIVSGAGATARIDVLDANGSDRRAVGKAPNGLLDQLVWAR